MHPRVHSHRARTGAAAICLAIVTLAALPQARAAEATPAAKDRKVLYWYDPMSPTQHFDKPGRSPFMDMDLVPKYAGEEPAGKADEGTVLTLSAEVVQSLGVRTALVERGDLVQPIRTLGRVEYDETRLTHIHPRAQGWISGLKLRAEGEPVVAGQELAQLYAPDILSAQVDFLIALEPQQGVRPVRADKARNLLRLLDVPEAVIAEIERTRETRNTVPILARTGGIVTQIQAREGMYVTPSTEMFTIADLSQVWVLVDVFERDVAGLAPGLPARIQVPAYPAETWEGRVDYLYPELDPKTRTLRVRLVFDNTQGRLKPNMFADVVIDAGARKGVLTIPREALIVTGEREAVVKDLGGGRFEPVDVQSGFAGEGRVEIRSGLAEGDRVVTSGQFLIDSEASLRAGFERLSPLPENAGQAPPKAQPGGEQQHRPSPETKCGSGMGMGPGEAKRP